MDAGAVGFTTSRTIGHKSRSGRPVPGTFAADEEILAIARAMGEAGHGVFEAIVAGTIGSLERLGGERMRQLDEVPLLESISRACQRPVTFTLAQLFEDPEMWREILDEVATANANGADLRPQIIPRSVTIMSTLDGYHMFMNRPTYQKIAQLPLAERVAEMRRREVREAILADSAPEGPRDFNEMMVEVFAVALPLMFPLTAPIDYEPDLNSSVFAEATARGVDPIEHMYDACLLYTSPSPRD